MAQFPSSIISFSTKVNGAIIDASDVNNPQNEITALETKVGVDNSSVVTSLDYLIKNPASGGGGHIQTPQYGGTGQTSYNKGDILVASSASVFGKVAIGSDGLSLLADSGQTTGVTWGTPIAAIPYGQDVGTGSVYAINPSPTIGAYTAGQFYVAKIASSNTVVSPAININSLGAKKIVNSDYSSVLVGQIPSSSLSLFGYDGSASVIQLLNPAVASYDSGQTSFTSVLGTGSVLIAHKIGRTPKLIEIFYTQMNGNNNTFVTGMGTFTNNGQSNTTAYPSNSTTNHAQSSYIINTYLSGGSTSGAASVVAVNANDFRLQWSTTPTNPIMAQWKAFA